ncbi:MAG: glycerophosphodiester phosphodiesterase family protein [Sporichthyaceae bacterium]
MFGGNEGGRVRTVRLAAGVSAALVFGAIALASGGNAAASDPAALPAGPPAAVPAVSPPAVADPTPTPSATPTASSTPKPTAAPETEPEQTAAPAPTRTPRPTQSPSTPKPKPTRTPTPAPLPAEQLTFVHKGVTSDAVRNTLPALQAAFDRGADGVEFDVVATATGQLIVLSDTNLGASSNCTGSTEDWDFALLRAQCLAKDGNPIPTLNEALAVVRDNGGKLMLHVKIYPDRAAAAAIVAALEKYGLNRAGGATSFAFHPPMLDMLRAAGAKRVGLIFNDTTKQHWGTRAYDVLVPYNTPVTRALVRAAQQDGVEVCPVETYGQYPLTVAEGMGMGVDAMILDTLPT